MNDYYEESTEIHRWLLSEKKLPPGIVWFPFQEQLIDEIKQRNHEHDKMDQGLRQSS